MRAILILLLLSCLSAQGANGAIDAGHAWAPPTAPGATVAAVYLHIHNNAALADRLLTVDTPLAAQVVVHQSRIVGGILQMREVDGVDCAPGGVLDSKPGGMHLMLMGITQPLRAGSQFPLSLHFRNAGTIVVDVTVEAAP